MSLGNIKIALPVGYQSSVNGRWLFSVVKDLLTSLGYLVVTESNIIKQVSSSKKVDNTHGTIYMQGKRRLNGFIRNNKNGMALLLETCLIDSVTPLIGVASMEGRRAIHPHLLPHCELLIMSNDGKDIGQQIKFFVIKQHRDEKLLDYCLGKLSNGSWNIKSAASDTDAPPEEASYPLCLKHLVETTVKRYAGAQEIIMFDEMDLRYQVLFRLTTYQKKLLANEGDASRIICETVQEQAAIIRDRNSTCRLPLTKLLAHDSILPGTNARIVKVGPGQVQAVDQQGNRRMVFFAQIDNNTANQYHYYLHYIHTPRTKEAWGLFADGDDLPFSVMAVDDVDRKYKRAGLRLFGYNHNHCLEYTRLYNCPGAPKNTSSVMFSQVSRVLRQQRPYLEAAISTYMPAYTKGSSMMTGGFNTTFMTKTLKHKFVLGDLGYEHMTKRRINDDLQSKKTQSQWLLEPVKELLASFRKPTLEPVLQIGRQIIET